MTTETRRNVTLMLKGVRLGFVDLAETRSINGGKPSYGATLIIEPGSAEVKAIDAAIEEVSKTQWKDRAADVLSALREKDRVAFLKRDYKSAEGKVFKGFEGKYALKTSAPEDKQPGCFDEFGQPLDTAGIRRKLYSGSFANVKVEIYPLIRDDGNRISCAILGAMHSHDGEAFGAGSQPATADDFAGMAKAKPDIEDLV